MKALIVLLNSIYLISILVLFMAICRLFFSRGVGHHTARSYTDHRAFINFWSILPRYQSCVLISVYIVSLVTTIFGTRLLSDGVLVSDYRVSLSLRVLSVNPLGMLFVPGCFLAACR